MKAGALLLFHPFGFVMTRSAVAIRRAAVAAACLFAVALAAAKPAQPRIGHVFIIVLENESYARTFGPNSQAPYLAKTLPAQGALLRQYYGVGHFSLDNYIAMISGQAPNDATQLDCPRFTDFELTSPKLDANGQALGKGCVYPAMVPMIGDQLDKAEKSWKGYMQDLGNDSSREVEACGHPVIGEDDPTRNKKPGDQYATKHNPFYYFHSFIDQKERCAAHVVNLRHLSDDLAKIESTPNYSFITPNLCDDGHDAPCVDHAPGGLVQADGFLKKWVPIITESPAFKKDGVLIITFDEASAPGSADSSACCGEQGLPGQSRQPGGNGPGGGLVGAVVLSPFVKPGTVSDVPYNHYSLLRWTEDLFGVPHLGYAAAPGLVTFGEDVFGK
jgi:phosphatidylinositol-3-phosphatase